MGTRLLTRLLGVVKQNPFLRRLLGKPYVVKHRAPPQVRRGKPLVSVVIPCYNYGRFLEEAIRSVHAQTLQDVEVIVVDDGSTDSYTLQVLERVREQGLAKVIRQVNRGLPAARNTGVRHAQGIYVCCLDADDTIAPTYLEKCVLVLEQDPQVGFVYSWVRIFGDEEGAWKMPLFDPGRLLVENIVSVAAVFRKRAWQEVGGYDEQMRSGYEDWEFWIRLTKRGWAGHRIPEFLFNYRRHGKTMYHDALRKHRQLVQFIKRKHPECQNVAQFWDWWHERHVRPRRVYRRPFANYWRASIRHPSLETPPVLLGVNRLTPGRTTRFALDLARALHPAYHVHVVTFEPNVVDKPDNEQEQELAHAWQSLFFATTPCVYQLPYYSLEMHRSALLRALIARHHIRLLINWNAHFLNTQIGFIRRQNPEIRVLGFPEELLGGEDGKETRKHIQEWDEWLCLTQACTHWARQTFRLPAERVHELFPGIDMQNMFNPQQIAREDLHRLQSQYGLARQSNPSTWIVGIGDPFDVLPSLEVASFVELLEEMAIPVVVLVMGIATNREGWTRLQPLWRQQTQFVRCIPAKVLSIQDALLHYALCDIWLIPPAARQKTERNHYWLAALCEALAMETLAIVPAMEETRQIAQYGQAVFLVGKNERQTYRQALEHVFTLMPSERARRKREARQQLQRAGFTLETTRKRLQVLLEKVLQPATTQGK